MRSSTGVLVLVLLLLGCSPSNRQECLAEASTKPSDAGVRLAVAQCQRAFPDSPHEQYLGPAGSTEAPAMPAQSVASPYIKILAARAAVDLVLLGVIAALVAGSLVTRALGGAGFLLLRGARLVCGFILIVAASSLVSFLLTVNAATPITSGMQAFALTKIVTIFIAGALFFALREFANWLHERSHGTPHPALAKSRWAL